MWCNNCGLIFPLRGGATVWTMLIALYSFIGSVFLFYWGPFVYFVYPEWTIYAVVALLVAGVALLAVAGLAARSYMLTRLAFFVWPMVMVLVAIRGGVMVYQLNKNQTQFRWECANDYALWPASATAEYAISGATMPSLVCDYGFHSFYIGVAVSLVLDLMAQIYGWFLVWRYKASLEHAYRLLQTESRCTEEEKLG